MKFKFENYLKQNPNTQEDTESIVRNTNEEAREEIDKTQLEKTELVQRLRDWRGKFFGSDVENDIESEMGNKKLFWNGNGFETRLRGGEKIELTDGEIASAYLWGTFWQFDESVSKDDQQYVMSQQIRELIAGKYDDQLTEFGRVNKLSDDRKRDTYEAINAQPTEIEKLSDGFLAERMVSTLLNKAQLDYDLPFTLQSVDVYEDVENKIDFIVSVSEHDRAVKVNEQGSDIGVQFTINTSEKKTEQKEKQIQHSLRQGEHAVDDIVLVSMPFKEIRDLFNQWRYDEEGNRKNEKRLDPRGPNMYMTDDMQVSTLQAIFKALPIDMTEDELREKMQGEQPQEFAKAA